MSARNASDHVEIDAEEVRSGRTGFHVRYIVLVWTLLVVAAFGLVALLN